MSEHIKESKEMSRSKPSRIILTSPQQQHTLQLDIDDVGSSLISTFPIHVSDMYIGTDPSQTLQNRLVTLEEASGQNSEGIVQDVLSQLVIPPMNTALDYTWTGTNTFQHIVCQDIDCVSDQRLKMDIIPLNNNSRLYELACYSYRFKADQDRLHYGVLAQEVAKVYPELVHNVGSFLAVDYQSLTILMLQELQQLRKELEKLKV